MASGKCVICRQSFDDGWLVKHRGRTFCQDCMQLQLYIINTVVREEIGAFRDTQEMLVEIAAWRYIIESWLSESAEAEEGVSTAQSGGAA